MPVFMSVFAPELLPPINREDRNEDTLVLPNLYPIDFTTVPIFERFTNWNLRVSSGDFEGIRNRRVKSQALANDPVEIRQGVDLVHAWHIGRHAGELCAKSLLDFRSERKTV